jgi:hypothetical protein
MWRPYCRAILTPRRPLGCIFPVPRTLVWGYGSTWTRIGGTVLTSVAYDLFLYTLVRFPAERLERSSSWSEMNHQYGYIQASSSQESSRDHRCPGWPCRAAFCPRRGDWEFDSQIGGGAENRLLFLPEHRPQSGDACLKTHVLLSKSESKILEKCSACSAEQVSASRGAFPTFVTRDGNAARNATTITLRPLSDPPSSQGLHRYWLFPAWVPCYPGQERDYRVYFIRTNPDSSRLHYRHYTVAADDDESFGFIRTPGMIDHTYRNAPYRNEPHNCARK